MSKIGYCSTRRVSFAVTLDYQFFLRFFVVVALMELKNLYNNIALSENTMSNFNDHSGTANFKLLSHNPNLLPLHIKMFISFRGGLSRVTGYS